jgi:ATP-dependent DNA helicase DinG
MTLLLLDNPYLPDRPSDVGIPVEGDTWRGTQEDIIPWVVSKFDAGEKIVVLNAPPGVGKTLISEAVMRIQGYNSVFLTGTKQLQDQYARSLPGMVDMRGRGNFTCIIDPAVTAAEGICTVNQECEAMHRGMSPEIPCHYYRRKKEAKDGREVVSGYQYFLRDSGIRKGVLADRDLFVLDEAHELEDHLGSWMEVVISKRSREVLGIREVNPGSHDWLQAVADLAGTWLNRNHATVEHWTEADARSRRDYSAVERLRADLVRVIVGLRDNPKAWVSQYDDFSGNLSYRPVLVADTAKRVFWERDWKGAGQYLLMSATISSVDLGELGLSKDDYSYREIPSPFPIHNRPIIYRPVTKVRATMTKEELGQWVAALDSILDEHEQEKGLIHTSNYKLAQWYLANSRFKSRLLSHTGATRTAELERFKSSRSPLVMVSPSMTTGVDLPYDSCRFQIIAKLSWPNRGDPRIARRMEMEGGDAWYANRTINHLAQAYGRGVRAEDDSAIMYILDGTFGFLRSKYGLLIPRWVTEAII